MPVDPSRQPETDSRLADKRPVEAAAAVAILSSSLPVSRPVHATADHTGRDGATTVSTLLHNSVSVRPGALNLL